MSAYLFGGTLTGGELEFVRAHPDLYEAACVAAGSNPFDAPEEDMRLAQPALTAAQLARWRELGDERRSSLLVGESGGELAALAVAGALSAVDAIWLAAVRGRLVSRACSELSLAALSLHELTLRDARSLAAAHELSIAHDNAPDQIVLTGRRLLVGACERTARRIGIRTVALAAPRAPACPELSAWRRQWREALDAAEVRLPRRPVFSCAAVGVIYDPRASLAEGLSASVRMRQTRRALARFGVRELAVVGTSRNDDALDAAGAASPTGA